MKANFRKNFKRLAKALGLALLLFISLLSLVLFSTGFQKFLVTYGIQQAFDPRYFETQIGQVTYNIDEGIVVRDISIRDRDSKKFILQSNQIASSLLRFLFSSDESYMHIDSLSMDLHPFFNFQSSEQNTTRAAINLSSFDLKHGYFTVPLKGDSTENILELNDFRIKAHAISVSPTNIYVKLDSLSGLLPDYNLAIHNISGELKQYLNRLDISHVQLAVNDNSAEISSANLDLSELNQAQDLSKLKGKIQLASLDIHPDPNILKIWPEIQQWSPYIQDGTVYLEDKQSLTFILTDNQWKTKGNLWLGYQDSTHIRLNSFVMNPKKGIGQLSFMIDKASHAIDTTWFNMSSVYKPIVNTELDSVAGLLAWQQKQLRAKLISPHFKINSQLANDSSTTDIVLDINQSKPLDISHWGMISGLTLKGFIQIDSSQSITGTSRLQIQHLHTLDKDYRIFSSATLTPETLQANAKATDYLDSTAVAELNLRKPMKSGQTIAIDFSSEHFSLPASLHTDSLTTQMHLLLTQDSLKMFGLADAYASFDQTTFSYLTQPYTIDYLDIDFRQHNKSMKLIVNSPNFLDIVIELFPKKKAEFPSNLAYISGLIPPSTFDILRKYHGEFRLDMSDDFVGLITQHSTKAKAFNLNVFNEQELYFDLSADYLSYGDLTLDNFELFNFNADQTIILQLDRLTYGGQVLTNLSHTQQLRNDTLFAYSRIDDTDTQFKLSSQTVIQDKRLDLHISDASLDLFDHLWTLSRPFDLNYSFANHEYSMSGFEASSSLEERIEIFSSKLHTKHIISGGISNLQLKEKGKGYEEISLSYNVGLDGNFMLSLHPDLSLDQFQSHITSGSHELNNILFDSLDINIRHNTRLDQWQIGHTSYIGTKPMVTSSGYIQDLDDYQFNFIFKNTPLRAIEHIALGHIRDFRGEFGGWLQLSATKKGPELNGALAMQQGGFTVEYLHTPILFPDGTTVRFKQNQIIFDDFEFTEQIGLTSARVKGIISNTNWDNWGMKLDLLAEKLQFINIPEDNLDQPFYGTISITGNSSLTAKQSFAEVHLQSEVKIDGASKVTIPLDKQTDASANQFISFKKPKTQVTDQTESAQFNKGFSMDMSIELTPDAQITISSENSYGDVIDLYSQGILTMQLENSELQLFGDINILRGNYLFTLNKTLRKQFSISPQSYLNWNGKLDQGDFRIIATSQTRIRLDQFLLNYDNKGKVPVEIELALTNSFSNPQIDFDIRLPYEPEQVKTEFNSYLINKDEKRKQSFSVLTTNSLITNNANGLLFGGLSGATLGLLSSQFSTIVSSFSDDLNLELVYDNSSTLIGDNTSQDVENNLELAFSQQFLNNRITVNGNVGLNVNEQSPSTAYLGDIEVLYDPIGDNSVNLRYYNKNNRVGVQNGPQQDNDLVQGVGINIRQNFNSFSELFRKLFNIEK